MCKKCQALKKIWWERQRLCYDLLSEKSDSYHVVAYERASAWKALWMQRNKHENRYYIMRAP